MIVKFIKNPVGKYNLSYEVGEVVSLPDAQAKELIEDGYALSIGVETAETKTEPEKAVMPSGKKKR